MQDVSASIDAIMPSDFQQALDGDTPEAEVAEYHDKIQDLGPSDISFKLDVKDAGMMLVNTIAPDFGWDSGQADVSARWENLLSWLVSHCVFSVKHVQHKTLEWVSIGLSRQLPCCTHCLGHLLHACQCWQIDHVLNMVQA